jgi:succinate dehydrogenase/fumarate reductase flavoprotein subunit
MEQAGNVDVIVVGGGNAALCAALSARGAGANVMLFERAPEDLARGNSGFASASAAEYALASKKA